LVLLYVFGPAQKVFCFLIHVLLTPV
jgi:hypothetical protein